MREQLKVGVFEKILLLKNSKSQKENKILVLQRWKRQLT